jgi:hypothetical protein
MLRPYMESSPDIILRYAYIEEEERFLASLGMTDMAAE